MEGQDDQAKWPAKQRQTLLAQRPQIDLDATERLSSRERSETAGDLLKPQSSNRHSSPG